MALYRSPLTVTLWPSSFLKKYGPMIPPAHKAQQTVSFSGSTRGLLATDHVILNHGQVTWTTSELAPPSPNNYHTTPREDVSAFDRFNVHRCPTRWVFSGTGLEPVSKQATVRYPYHSATTATTRPKVTSSYPHWWLPELRNNATIPQLSWRHPPAAKAINKPSDLHDATNKLSDPHDAINKPSDPHDASNKPSDTLDATIKPSDPNDGTATTHTLTITYRKLTYPPTRWKGSVWQSYLSNSLRTKVILLVQRQVTRLSEPKVTSSNPQ
ncbi:uncharacterized protein TNCV_2321171 [Trichonephila clavipes]|nr:uncharacterized protein TNCV_2321171 [Trichonephila clavipes]